MRGCPSEGGRQSCDRPDPPLARLTSLGVPRHGRTPQPHGLVAYLGRLPLLLVDRFPSPCNWNVWSRVPSTSPPEKMLPFESVAILCTATTFRGSTPPSPNCVRISNDDGPHVHLLVLPAREDVLLRRSFETRVPHEPSPFGARDDLFLHELAARLET